MTIRANAAFKNLTHDQTPYDAPAEGPALSRVTIRREFHGDLDGVSSAVLTPSRSP